PFGEEQRQHPLGAGDRPFHELAAVGLRELKIGVVREHFHHAAHRCWKRGGRFSRKAAIPSFWSAVSNRAANSRFSTARPSVSEVSIAASSVAFAAYSEGSDFDAMVSASLVASSSRSDAGTTRETSPMRSASSASISRPESTSSAAL